MKKMLSNGDCLRLLHIPKKDGSLITSLPLTYCYVKEHNRILYDNTGLMNKIWRKLRKLSLDSSNIGSRTWFYTENNGEVKYIEVGRKLTNIIKGYNFSYDSDDHLLVDIKEVSSDYYYKLSSYDDSKIVKGEVIFNSEKEYLDFIIKNQSGYLEDIFYENSVTKNIDIIKSVYPEAYGLVMEEERENKLNELLK